MEHFISGHSNTSLWRLQQSHDGEEITFRARYKFWKSIPHERVLKLICNTAFGNILDIGSVEINNHLLTIMVERWRPEIHTFHFPNGECTITLEDVAYQLGLPMMGKLLLETQLWIGKIFISSYWVLPQQIDKSWGKGYNILGLKASTRNFQKMLLRNWYSNKLEHSSSK
ncbi:hypothetical protein Lal_00015844 [Lupinus albus]|nr:hypothetical protein Lal_00015844 [Lupinus albus]